MEIEKSVMLESNERRLSEDRRTQEAKILAPTLALAVYGLIVTVFFCATKAEVIKTIPLWFVRIGELIRLLFTSIADYVSDLARELNIIAGGGMPEAVRYLIPVAIIIVIAVVVALFIVKPLAKALKSFNKELWGKYSRTGVKGRKKAFTAFICGVSFLISVAIASIEGNPLNVLTWFLIFSTTANIIYHAKSYKERYY